MTDKEIRIKSLEFASVLTTNWTVKDLIVNAEKLERYIHAGLINAPNE